MKSVRDHLASRSVSASSFVVEVGGNKRWALLNGEINASL